MKNGIGTDSCPGTCVDTPGWTNKGLHKHKGYTCDDYKNKRWCANGGFPKGMEWTGKRGTIHSNCRKHDSSGDCAAVYNYPGENCCTCGKEGHGEQLQSRVHRL